MTFTSINMTDSLELASRLRRTAFGAVLVVSAATTACGDGGSRHATDGDTGAAAPATVRDMSATPQVGDSTAGVANPTGRPNQAGDTLQARGVDSTRSPAGGSPARP
jgi:hypothetical protein